MALAGIRDATAELFQLLVLGQRRGGQVEQPGRDHAATPPHLGDIGHVEVETLILGQLVGRLALQYVEPFRIGLHNAVLDSVMNHFHEVT